MKPLSRKHTAVVMTMLVALAVLWEIAVLGLGHEATISEWVWSLTENPLVPFVVGFVMGHLFFPKSKCVHCGRPPYRSSRTSSAAVAALVAIALLTLPACAGFKLPAPNPTPPPTDPTPPPADGPPDGARVCNPGETCGCAHRPPGQAWQVLPPCGAPPTPEEGCSIDGEPGPALPGHRNELGQAVNQAIAAVYACSGGRCQVSDGRQVAQRKIVEQLRKQGLCAGQHAPDTDEIAVATSSSSPREGYHVYAGPSDGPGTLVLSPNADRVAWAARSGPQPPRPPTDPTPPPAIGACGAPIPPKFDRYNLHAHLNTNDATGLVYNRETRRWDGSVVEGYCDSQGFVNRLHCPVRQEGAPDREACEQVAAAGVVGGKPKWTSDGQVHLTDNPYQATCSSCTWLAISNADGSAEKRCAIAPGSGQCAPE